MKTLKTWTAAAAMLALSGAAQAALISNSNGTVKDTNTNLIWLQNWNVNGLQNWGTQKGWAEGLSFAGSNDWVLPSISQYVDLVSAYGILTSVSQFTNVGAGNSDRYWSGTVITPGISAWGYFSVLSAPTGGLLGTQFFAVAVRPGDVTASVPEPQTLALALLALGATVVARRRRAR